MTDRQQAVKLRLGAHLGLALGYLPVPVPTPQAALNIRTQEDIQADPDADTLLLNSSDDLPLQVQLVICPPLRCICDCIDGWCDGRIYKCHLGVASHLRQPCRDQCLLAIQVLQHYAIRQSGGYHTTTRLT